MAGNYPDVPNNRVQYDLDGSVITDGTSVVVTSVLLNLNKDVGNAAQLSIGSFNGANWMLIFPYQLDINGIFFAGTHSGNGSSSRTITAWSTNTTNGIDGTWNAVSIASNTNSFPYRTVTPVSWLNVRAIRFNHSTGSSAASAFTHLHVYGRMSTGYVPDRLEIWHPTLNQRVTGAYFDWGDTPRTSSADRQFRVKNLSATYTANSVAVQFNADSGETTPSIVSQHFFSTDGIDFYGSLNLGALAPGALSPVITLRRTTASNASMSLWTTRIRAVPASWS